MNQRITSDSRAVEMWLCSLMKARSDEGPRPCRGGFDRNGA